MARRLGDSGTLASVLLARNLAMGSPESYEEHRANATESLRLAEELGDGQLRAWAIMHLFLVHLWLGDVDTAVDLVGEGERAFAAIKEPAAFLFDQIRGCMAVVEGRLPEAEALLRRGFAGGQEVRDPNTFLTFGASMTFLRLLQGRAIELAGSVEAMMATMSGAGAMAHGARSLMFSLHGMLDSARAQLDLVDPTDPSSLPRNVLLLGSLQALARACLLVDDGAKAEVIYSMMAPHQRCDAVIGWVPLGPVNLGLGCAAAACGRTDAAAVHFEAALATVRARGWKSHIAETELHYAPLLAQRDGPGDRERALAMTEELIAVSAELGAADHLSAGRALRGQLLSEEPAARARHPTPSRWDRTRARLTGFGQAAVATWTNGRSDDDLVRRFSGIGPQRLFFSAMARAFQPAMAFGFEGDITLDLRPPNDDGDPAAGDWWTIEVRGRRAAARSGRSSNPAVLIHAPLALFLRIAAGEAHPAIALIDNAVEVEGDVLLAARLPDMFGAVRRMPSKEPSAH